MPVVYNVSNHRAERKADVRMFPYAHTERWHVGAYAFQPFAALVAIAIGVGYLIALRRAKRSGIGREHFTKLGLCVIVAAFLGGHLAKFVYSPDAWRVITTQPAALLDIFRGQASFGSFFGGYLAALIFLFWNSIPYPEWYLYADASCFAVPFAWWIGRVGCYLVHDHPGLRTSSFLGVRYPGGTRYDLGLLEVLFLIALAAVFLFLDRRPRPRGFFYVAFLFSYGSFRFLLDRLHVDPPRYGGFTVDQLAASVLLVAAVLTILELMRLDRASPCIMSSPEVA
jgi:phosphatidylglycerol:prolipoprotein diacylglycerol transferase